MNRNGSALGRCLLLDEYRYLFSGAVKAGPARAPKGVYFSAETTHKHKNLVKHAVKIESRAWPAFYCSAPCFHINQKERRLVWHRYKSFLWILNEMKGTSSAHRTDSVYRSHRRFTGAAFSWAIDQRHEENPAERFRPPICPGAVERRRRLMAPMAPLLPPPSPPPSPPPQDCRTCRYRR